ncbi:OLC1v1029886C1 [Oldenlandia corymbosa var. corymbosa]|uniref:OLC1v1029886C1 n=1 Tax=Oldenlandia corymbosa var. corymbosa TaxID=529605 RepID=A0AAV1CFI9_OLDCO|nr:OLC1v1029886C1 [Oldenlandia corymbosa var. corymbosa]
MAEDSHVLPLAPPQTYRRSDEEWAAPPPGAGRTSWKKIARDNHFYPIKHSKSSKCFVYSFTLLVSISLCCLIFALIVLRIGYPKLKLESIQVKDLSYSVANDDHNNSRVSLNVTVVADIKLSNDNFGRFKFQNGSTSVVYGNTTLGMTDIEGGIVRGRKAKKISVVVQLESNDDLAQNVNFSSDVGSNLVKLNGYAQLRGQVKVVKFVTKHKTSFMNCSMSLNLTSQAIQDLRCL